MCIRWWTFCCYAESTHPRFGTQACLWYQSLSRTCSGASRRPPTARLSLLWHQILRLQHYYYWSHIFPWVIRFHSNNVPQSVVENQTQYLPWTVLVHYRKTFSTYLFFASSLIGQCPQLQGIRAFGTDSKQPLINAFKHKFTFSHHITCFIHVCWNIKEKLNDCSVPTNVGQVVLDDIFGQHVGTVFEEDLVDSFDIMIFRVNSNLYWRNGAIWRHLVQ